MSAAVNDLVRPGARARLIDAVDELRDTIALAVAPEHLRRLVDDAVEFEIQLLQLRCVIGTDPAAMRSSLRWVFDGRAVSLGEIAERIRLEVAFVQQHGLRVFEPILEDGR